MKGWGVLGQADKNKAFPVIEGDGPEVVVIDMGAKIGTVRSLSSKVVSPTMVAAA